MKIREQGRRRQLRDPLLTVVLFSIPAGGGRGRESTSLSAAVRTGMIPFLHPIKTVTS